MTSGYRNDRYVPLPSADTHPSSGGLRAVVGTGSGVMIGVGQRPAGGTMVGAGQRLPSGTMVGAVQRPSGSIVGVGVRPESGTMASVDVQGDGSALYEAAIRLADRLEGDALRYAKVLDVLDVTRSRGCLELAGPVRDAASRLRAWKWNATLSQRQADLALWDVLVRKAKQLGVEVSRAA